MGIGKFLKQHKFSHRAWMYYELYIKNFRKKIKKYYSQYGEETVHEAWIDNDARKVERKWSKMDKKAKKKW